MIVTKHEDDVRYEVTPTGVVVEYIKNDHGGEDVIVHLPRLEEGGSGVQDFTEKT